MRLRWVVPAAVVVAWVLIGCLYGSLASNVSPRDGTAAFLPADAESTAVLRLLQEPETMPAARDAGALVIVAGLVVLLILLMAYRSPVLPLVVLVAAGLALAVANGIVHWLAGRGAITLSDQSQGILDVLVLGAGTGYALHMVSRYREELHRRADAHDAMRSAWRGVVEPVVASGGAVVMALLCLLASDLAANRGLAPVGAIGVACALLAMLTLLPAAPVLLGRAAFWPFPPRYGARKTRRRGIWAGVATLVRGHSRVVWVSTLLVLLGLTFGLTRLQAHGVPLTITASTVDTTAGRAELARHAADDSGGAEIIANPGSLNQVVAAARGVQGVTAATPNPHGGLARVEATMAVEAGSSAAAAVVDRLREAVHAVPGADAKVGGLAAVIADAQRASRHDRTVIVPLVLVAVFVVLSVLLRALLGPLLIVLTLLLSFVATLGVSGVMFSDVFRFAGADSSFPLFAFVLVVALGVDCNVFLMTRVREEVRRRGHRAGTLAALKNTGGTITSAGVVLAAAFCALSVQSPVLLVEVAFAVAFGILLGTLVVRSVLVPAVAIEVGPALWWPSALRRTTP